MNTKDDDRRKPYSGNRTQGPGRRTYPNATGNAPRVGRIAQNVPRAQRVDSSETGETMPPSRPARGGWIEMISTSPQSRRQQVPSRKGRVD